MSILQKNSDEENRKNVEVTKIHKSLMRKSIQITSYYVYLLIFFFSGAVFVISPLMLNSIIQQESTVTFFNIALIIAIILIGHTINALSIYLKGILLRDYQVKTTSLLYMHVFNMTYDSYLDEGPNNLLFKTNRAANAYSLFYLETIPDLIIGILLIISTLAIAFTVNPLVAGIMMLTLPINYFGYKISNKKTTALSIEMNDVEAETWATATSIMSQVDFIKQNPRNEWLRPIFESFTFAASNMVRRVNNWSNLFAKILASATQIINSILIIILASMMLDDVSAVGGAVLVMLVLPYFFSSVSSVTSNNFSFVRKNAADAFITEINENYSANGHIKINKINQIDINIDKVTVKEKILLEDVKLTLKKGDTIGIIGESGMGKSTLAKVLAKFRPSDGVFVDGIPLADIENSSYLQLVSYFSQNTPIVTGSLLENLNLGREPLGKDVYRKLDFLSKFSDLDEMILENGANLSGGDKQRIALSRYFVENSQLVILDEPTNSLDESIEQEILSSIFASKEDKIIILISHNTENMKYCDSVYKVEDKKLVRLNS